MTMLEYLKSIGKLAGKTVSDGAQHLSKMNEQRAQLNRLRNAMKEQEELAQKEYITLGRYYYSTLRDENNRTTEPHCERLDSIDAKVSSLIETLEEYYAQIAEEKNEESEIEIDLQYAKELTKEQAKELSGDVSKKAGDLKDTVKIKLDDMMNKASKDLDDVMEDTDEIKKTVEDTATAKGDELRKKAREIIADAENMSDDIKDKVLDGADEGENDNLPFE